MNFEYKINEDDDSISNVNMDESFYNYEKTNLHTFDQSYETIYNYILNNDSIVYDYLYPKNNFNKKYVKDSILLWEKLGITLHDINIIKRFVNFDKLVEFNDKTLTKFELKPTKDLRLKFKRIPQDNSLVRFLEIDQPNYKNIVFKEILLPRLDKKLASTIYAHELSHAQLVTKNGGTNSIFQEEMIPILMEFIFANELDNDKFTLKYVKNERLFSVLKFINLLSKGNTLSFDKRVICEKYIISSFQALQLFDIYYRGNSFIKKEILKYIRDIFNGELIIEDLLHKYSIDYNDNEKNLKLIKNFDF